MISIDSSQLELQIKSVSECVCVYVNQSRRQQHQEHEDVLQGWHHFIFLNLRLCLTPPNCVSTFFLIYDHFNRLNAIASSNNRL